MFDWARVFYRRVQLGPGWSSVFQSIFSQGLILDRSIVLDSLSSANWPLALARETTCVVFRVTLAALTLTPPVQTREPVRKLPLVIELREIYNPLPSSSMLFILAFLCAPIIFRVILNTFKSFLLNYYNGLITITAFSHLWRPSHVVLCEPVRVHGFQVGQNLTL